MTVTIGRRELLAALGGAAAWPLAARAQQTAKLPTIGFLGQSTRLAATEWTAAFVQRLRELGRIEDRTITIEYRWGEGREERFAEIAAEFVRLNVDTIVTSEPPRSLQRSKRQQSSRLCLRRREIRLGPAWLRVWRDLAATSLDYRLRLPIWLPSALKSSARLSLVCAAWRS
jgi:hypothetical protein